MATTTNYSWTTPDDTDLVKDGASAIRSLGTAIDSTVFTNAGNAVQKATIDAKGDLLVGTADNTIGRLAVGTNNYVLTADSNETSGLKWAAAAGGTPTFVGCSLYKSANQSINNTTTTVVTWNSEVFDTDAFHDTSTNTERITIPSGKDGKYQLIWIIEFPANGNGQRSASLRKNGSFISYTNVPANANSAIKMYGSFIIDAVATDYFDVTVYQDSSASQDVVGALNYSAFQAIYLGA